MKHLKPFNIFEAVIIPTPIEDNANVNSFESAVAFGQRNDFDVVDYDEFYKNKGWKSWTDFLGNEFLPFEEAREFFKNEV